MNSLVSSLRVLMVVGLVPALIGAMPARAEDAAMAAPAVVAIEPWQEVITSQIEAFRHKDAKDALKWAGAGFQVAFPTPEAFFVAIIQSGYAPIMDSRSHSFGTFEKMGDNVVVQAVKLVGTDQSLYEAFYQLAEEPDGWRVQGVQLIKQNAIGI
jgi:precorrin-3B methylase